MYGGVTLQFAICNPRIDILGEELAELFELLTRAKIGVVRQGSHVKSIVREIRLSET